MATHLFSEINPETGKPAIYKIEDGASPVLSVRYNKLSSERASSDNSDSYTKFMNFVDPFGAYRGYMRLWGFKL